MAWDVFPKGLMVMWPIQVVCAVLHCDHSLMCFA